MTYDLLMTDWNSLHLMPVARPDDAHYLADLHEAGLLAMLKLIETENAYLSAGQVEEALALFDDKHNHALHYARSCDLVRRNLVAMTRLIPKRLADLKMQHQTLMDQLNENAKLISILRSLSETLLRNVAQDTHIKNRVTTYGENGRETKPGVRAPSSAIIVSTSL